MVIEAQEMVVVGNVPRVKGDMIVGGELDVGRRAVATWDRAALGGQPHLCLPKVSNG